MPEDLPRAVLVLVWLLIGVIILGYLIMDHTYTTSFIFSISYFGAPVLWTISRKKSSES